MTWGIGSALIEENHVDPRYGSFVNQDLASYHVAVNADVGALDVMFLDETDHRRPAERASHSHGQSCPLPRQEWPAVRRLLLLHEEILSNYTRGLVQRRAVLATLATSTPTSRATRRHPLRAARRHDRRMAASKTSPKIASASQPSSTSTEVACATFVTSIFMSRSVVN